MSAIGLTETAIRRIRSHELVIEIGLRVEDDELAQAIVDLSRTARRELLGIGLIPAFTEAEASSYEMILTQHLMPEIAARLSRGSPAPLMLSREETGDGSLTGVSGAELRRLTGLCWSRSEFARIGAAVRTRFDPDGRKADKVFATEVIGQEPANGNLLEIALGRAAPPELPAPTREQDWFADRILEAGRLRGLDRPGPVWTPELRFWPSVQPEETAGPEPV
jgi:hypothetical protein